MRRLSLRTGGKLDTSPGRITMTWMAYGGTRYAPSGASRTARGGVVKGNVRILVTLAVAVGLLFLVRHWFPQAAPR
jgi:hypothetical protein